jgi:hypothetical protein
VSYGLYVQVCRNLLKSRAARRRKALAASRKRYPILAWICHDQIEKVVRIEIRSADCDGRPNATR